MSWKPEFPGERPTLGWGAIEWIESNLAAPDRGSYEPLLLTREQAEFVLRFYEVDPKSGRRVIRRGVLSRPRGWGKSPFVSALCILEGLGDVLFDGWDAKGRPVGKPWSTVRTPLVQLAAVSDTQVMTNAWPPLLEMLDPELDPPVLENYRGLEPMGTFVNLPRGRIMPITASGSTAKGARAVFSVWDQTEEWTSSNGGVGLAKILADNAAKVGGAYVETPNAFVPGLGSVAERSAETWAAISEGRTRLDKGLLYDHREAPADTDLTDRESLLQGLRFAYGDSSADPRGCVIHDPPCEPGWADHDAHIARIWDPDNDEQNARANFLGQITHASDSYLSRIEWDAVRDAEKVVRDGELITLGFDGSRGRAKGKPDATALIGCRVSDGHLFEVFVDEADDRPETWADWSPNIGALEEHIEECFTKYRVAFFYADPGRDWRSHVNAWEAKFATKTALQGRRDHPFEWWMTGGRASLVERAVEQLESAVRNRDLTHGGSPRLTAHVLNARRRLSHGKLALGKESPSSSLKIDAAVAAVLAWQARLDALSKGAAEPRKKKTYAVKRLR